jgi:ATP sulphurylase
MRLIPTPYGGTLVEAILAQNQAKRLLEQQNEFLKIKPPIEQIYDAEKIALGAYSPLQGFMDEEDYTRVLNRNELKKGLVWTIPIVLTPKGDTKELKPGDEALLLDLFDQPFALLKLEQKFKIDKGEFAEKVYATRDTNHPNVAELSEYGETALSGKVELLRALPNQHGGVELTPRETREYFQKMGWKNVAAYQARNPPHKAHEYIQRLTLERDDVDALFIHPIVGKLKKGDYKPEVIMEAYKVFVEKYYPKNRVLLSALSIAMRYAGPKAVLFYAIIRRNYGCSHYIVGRDQAGVGSYYDPYAAHAIFDKYDVGVVPLRYQETFYCRVCEGMVSSKVCPHPESERVSTSQTKIRELLQQGKPLPKEILRQEVIQILERGDVLIK